MELYPLLKLVSQAMIITVTILFAYQLAYLFIPLLKQRRKTVETKKLRYAVLIAARNEELVLPHLLDSIRTQDYPAELIDMYVVADNCTDNTAQVAAEHGAIVYPRFNKRQVGKGYALNYLLGQIKRDIGWNKYDAFLIFDADNLLEPDYISNINQLPSQGFQAFCGYRNTKNFGTNWLTSGYGLWYLHESSHMNRSRFMLGSGCQVNGTGFGFTSALLERMNGWNFFTLTEDLEFNNYCATNGIKIGYCYDAILYDEQPLTFSQSWKQRTRWAKGGMQVSFKYGSSLFKNLFRFGWKAYTCFELLTLSFWGFAFGTLTSFVTLTTVYMGTTALEFGIAMVLTVLGTYLSMVLTGFLTILLEWKRIRATTTEKVWSIFTFPFFMMTFAPITICSVFSKRQWAPIAHTVAISNAELLQR